MTPGLGRRVVDLPGVAHRARRRGDVDDAPALLPHHHLGRRPRHQEAPRRFVVHARGPSRRPSCGRGGRRG